MADTLVNETLAAGVWVDIYAATGITVGEQLKIQNLGTSVICLHIGLAEPTKASGFILINPGETHNTGEKESGVWLHSVFKTGLVGVNIYINTGFPIGAFTGLRAVIAQTYTEANSKLGVEHEGSTLYTAAGLTANDTFFVTGALPVALKGRIIGFTGSGVTAEIFTGATYTGGTSAAYQNASDINPVTGLVQIIVGASVVSEGTLAFAPNHLIGNTSKQGKGTSGQVTGRESLLKPNTVYLFRITSLDSQTQDVTSLLTWYEGELDLPL